MEERGRSEAQGLVRNVSRARMQIISGPVDSAFKTGFPKVLVLYTAGELWVMASNST